MKRWKIIFFLPLLSGGLFLGSCTKTTDLTFYASSAAVNFNLRIDSGRARYFTLPPEVMQNGFDSVLKANGVTMQQVVLARLQSADLSILNTDTTSFDMFPSFYAYFNSNASDLIPVVSLAAAPAGKLKKLNIAGVDTLLTSFVKLSSFNFQPVLYFAGYPPPPLPPSPLLMHFRVRFNFQFTAEKKL